MFADFFDFSLVTKIYDSRVGDFVIPASGAGIGHFRGMRPLKAV